MDAQIIFGTALAAALTVALVAAVKGWPARTSLAAALAAFALAALAAAFEVALIDAALAPYCPGGPGPRPEECSHVPAN